MPPARCPHLGTLKWRGRTSSPLLRSSGLQRRCSLANAGSFPVVLAFRSSVAINYRPAVTRLSVSSHRSNISHHHFPFLIVVTEQHGCHGPRSNNRILPLIILTRINRRFRRTFGSFWSIWMTMVATFEQFLGCIPQPYVLIMYGRCIVRRYSKYYWPSLRRKRCSEERCAPIS